MVTQQAPSPEELAGDALVVVTTPNDVAIRKTAWVDSDTSPDVTPRSNRKDYTPESEGPDTTVSEVTVSDTQIVSIADPTIVFNVATGREVFDISTPSEQTTVACSFSDSSYAVLWVRHAVHNDGTDRATGVT